MKFPSARWTSATAFTLVEVALALGVASFCLVAVMALVPLGVDTGQMASDQTTAGSILTQVLADLRATPKTSPPGATTTSTEYTVPIPANTAGAPATTPTVRYFGNSAQLFSLSPVSGTSRYRLTISFLPPAGGRTATQLTLLVSWPPQVDPANAATGMPTGRVQIFAALDRN